MDIDSGNTSIAALVVICLSLVPGSLSANENQTSLTKHSPQQVRAQKIKPDLVAVSTANGLQNTVLPHDESQKIPKQLANADFENTKKSTAEVATHIMVTDGCGPNYQGACLNVRSGPSTKNSVVTRLRNDVILKVAEVRNSEGRTWYRTEFDEWLRYPNRTSGEWWIAGDFVQSLQATKQSANTPGQLETNKRIIVDLSEQKLFAYDGNRLFMKESVSTGKESYPTPRGSFPVYKKTPTRYMQGPIPNITDQHFDLPGVPWNLYFTYQGAVIHGAYWHDNFGQPWSNGCVNLPPREAERLYKWADLGTTVTVQY
jgi:lipoprotein-anchoring transpeptidase ErfK/SrfK